MAFWGRNWTEAGCERRCGLFRAEEITIHLCRPLYKLLAGIRAFHKASGQQKEKTVIIDCRLLQMKSIRYGWDQCRPKPKSVGVLTRLHCSYDQKSTPKRFYGGKFSKEVIIQKAHRQIAKKSTTTPHFPLAVIWLKTWKQRIEWFGRLKKFDSKDKSDIVTCPVFFFLFCDDVWVEGNNRMEDICSEGNMARGTYTNR